MEATEQQGLPVDARSYETAAEVLRELGLHRVRVLSNNPDEAAEFRAHGIDVTDEVPILVGASSYNVRCLRTGRDRMADRLGALDDVVSLASS